MSQLLVLSQHPSQCHMGSPFLGNGGSGQVENTPKSVSGSGGTRLIGTLAPFVQNHAATCYHGHLGCSGGGNHLRTAPEKTMIWALRNPSGLLEGRDRTAGMALHAWLPPFSHTSSSWPPLCSCLQSGQMNYQTTHPGRGRKLKVLGGAH